MGPIIRLMSVAFILAVLIIPSQEACAQVYPSKPVRMVVPYPPGGFTDILARVIAQKLGERWNVQVLVENKSGGGGNIGTDAVAKSAPDGYTLLTTTSGIAINATLYSKLPYDPLNDFSPVCLLGSTPFFLMVHPSVQAKTVGELIALAKSKPGQLNYGSNGIGTTTHLAAELLKSMAGVNIVHIPYKGEAPAVTALLSGEIPMLFVTIPAALPQTSAGKLRALAVSSIKRSPAMPDLPTIAESGLAGFDASPWYGTFAPAGTPKEIVGKINTEIVKALNLPDVQARFSSKEGTDLAGDTPEQFTAYYKEEIKKWGKVIKESGARVE